MSRAEIARWFSKSFGLNIENILGRESDTGVKHAINMKSNLLSDLLSAPQEQEKSLKYSTEEDNKQIEEILYLLNKFCVGGSFFPELSMVTDGLPKAYLIQQCRAELNKVCHIERLSGKTAGSLGERGDKTVC